MRTSHSKIKGEESNDSVKKSSKICLYRFPENSGYWKFLEIQTGIFGQMESAHFFDEELKLWLLILALVMDDVRQKEESVQSWKEHTGAFVNPMVLGIAWLLLGWFAGLRQV